MLSNDDFKAFQGNANDMKLLLKLCASSLLYSGAHDLMVYNIITKIFFCTKHFLVHVKNLLKDTLSSVDILGLLL